MKIHGIDHTAVLAADVERSRHFYRDILGMEEIPRPKTFDFPGAWFRQGTAEVHVIGEAEAGRARLMYPGAYRPDEQQRGYGGHFAFEIDDVAQAMAELQAKDAPICGPIRNRGDGVMQMYLCDPDGYIVELFSRTGKPLY
jgi:catechol 2,3-dioxygenase-like lactoylglutathione lyase family enzyme